jgi:hypothetical protein
VSLRYAEQREKGGMRYRSLSPRFQNEQSICKTCVPKARRGVLEGAGGDLLEDCSEEYSTCLLYGVLEGFT